MVRMATSAASRTHARSMCEKVKNGILSLRLVAVQPSALSCAVSYLGGRTCVCVASSLARRLITTTNTNQVYIYSFRVRFKLAFKLQKISISDMLTNMQGSWSRISAPRTLAGNYARLGGDKIISRNRLAAVYVCACVCACVPQSRVIYLNRRPPRPPSIVRTRSPRTAVKTRALLRLRTGAYYISLQENARWFSRCRAFALIHTFHVQ